MTQRTLTEEKEDLIVKLSDIISRLEKVKIYQIDITDIIPTIRGLKVVYNVATDRVRQWSRTIKYSDLANKI